MNRLNEQYPSSETLKHFLKSFDSNEKKGFLRLWLSEGIPYSFKIDPLSYEEIRTYISNELDIHPKDIILIGSAKIGISLTPQQYGKPFSQESDHDFSIISNSLFDKCVNAFQKWHSDYSNGYVSPKNEMERKYWLNNSNLVPRNITSGFIDPYKIPNHENYQPAGEISNLSWMIGKKYILNKVGFRIYKNWNSFFNQALINLDRLIEKL